MKVATYAADGTSGGEASLPAEVFDGMVNQDALHQVVTAAMAHRRQGTASTKTRSSIRGGSRKPWRQKGTGRARAGSVRSPIWRGGSVIFGPHPRSYDVRVPRQLRRLAIRSALNARALDGDLALVAPLELEEPKTRRIVELLEAIGAGAGNVLILTDGLKPLVYRSARNIPRVRVSPWSEVSAYDVLWSDLVLVEASAFAAAEGDAAGGDGDVTEAAGTADAPDDEGGDA